MKATVVALLFAAGTFAQMLPTFPKPVTQSTAWNSSSKFSEEQIELGQLWPDLADNLETILNFDRSQLANDGPSRDIFYQLNNDTCFDPPHTPGQSKGKAPVVLWSHGTSAYFADGSASAHRALFYDNIMPFTLAQACYAVIATDYAGLGVQISWDGSYVPHQYQNRLVNAFDSLYALRAARTIFFDKITDGYVNVGHSQGGSASWVSEVLAENSHNKFQDLLGNYLGTILFAPGIDALNSVPKAFCSWIGKDPNLMYPDFNLSDWLSPLDINRTELLTQIQGGQYVSELLFLANATEMLNPTWNESWYATAFTGFTNPGNRPYKAPMIMFQGTEDQGTEPYMRALSTFESTCKNHHSGALEFVSLPGQWLQWIENRFNGEPVGSNECTKSTLNSFLPADSYQELTTSFPQWAGAADEFFELFAGGF